MTILIAKCLNQIGNRDAQSVSNSSQVLERRVTLSAFDACDLANYLARFGELFGKIKQSRAGAIGGQLLSDPG
jgi:hypothetical protein